VDYHLNKLLKETPMFLRDLKEVVEEMRQMNPLPPRARLFTWDATAMHTNIEPEVGIAAVRNWLETAPNLPTELPSKLVLETLDIVMNTFFFQIDDMF
jgi:hypothetical protein